MKALKARAEAIKRAIAEYNRRAAELVPPRPSLSWNDILEMSTLADFDLLRDTRQDIRKLPWAQPLRRRAMNMHFNIKRAHEEIQRLNVEIPRLITSMLDEHIDYYRAISTSMMTNPPLARELSQRWQQRDLVHARIAQHLREAAALPSFSGKLITGRRVGRASNPCLDIPYPVWATLAGSSETSSLASDAEEVNHIPGAETEREEEAFLDYVDGLGGEEAEG